MPRKGGGVSLKEGISARHFCCGCIVFLSAVLFVQFCVLANLLRRLGEVQKVPEVSIHGAAATSLGGASADAPARDVQADATSGTGTSETAKKQGLAMGTAFNVGSDGVLAFLATLLHFSPQCDVVIFCDQPLTKDVMEGLKIDTARVKFETALPQLQPWSSFSPSSQRYWLFKSYLDRAQSFKSYFESTKPLEAYQYVQITDVDDVAFQADPFVWAARQRPGLHLFEDEPGVTVGTETQTMQSLGQCFGDQAANQIKEQNSVPSGYAIGTPKEVQFYLENMVEQLQAHTTCQKDKVDAAIHNAIIRSAALTKELNLHVHENRRGAVWTGARVSTASIQLDSGNYIINQDGYRYAVLHQYDQHDQVWKLISDRHLGGRKKQVAAQDCTSFDVANGDLRGFDLTHTPADNEKECCIACLGDSSCGAFVFSDGARHCWMKRTGAGPRINGPPGLRAGISKRLLHI
jgi:hypothetical protein